MSANESYWKQAPAITRLALALAAVAMLLNLASYAGLGMDDPLPIYLVMHRALLVVCLCTFTQIARWRALRRRGADAVGTGISSYPARLWVALGISIVYAAIILVQSALQGEGGPAIIDGRRVWAGGPGGARPLSINEYQHAQMMMLRGFSAAWIAFSLAAAGTYDRVTAAIKRRSDRPVVARDLRPQM